MNYETEAYCRERFDALVKWKKETNSYSAPSTTSDSVFTKDHKSIPITPEGKALGSWVKRMRKNRIDAEGVDRVKSYNVSGNRYPAWLDKEAQENHIWSWFLPFKGNYMFREEECGFSRAEQYVRLGECETIELAEMKVRLERSFMGAESGEEKVRTPLEIASDVAVMVIVGDKNIDTFITVMKNKHKLMQQEFTRLCLKWIKENQNV